MYTDLIKENIMQLDMDFYTLNYMFETVDTIEMIKTDEIIYEYGYTHNIDDCVDEMLYETEQQSDQKKKGIVSKMIDAIINFIRNVRIKILKAFGNDEKAKEIEAKLNQSKGNVKINTYEKELNALEEEENLFKEMINKIKNGTITEQDAEKVKNKHSNVMAIIGGVAGGAAAVGITVRIVDLFKVRTKVKDAAESSKDTEKDLNDAKNAVEGKSEDSPSVKAAKEVLNTYNEFSKQKAKVVTNASTEVNNKINEVFAKENNTTNTDSNNQQQTNQNTDENKQQSNQNTQNNEDNKQTQQPTSEQNNQQQTNQNTDENKQQSNQNTQNNEDNNQQKHTQHSTSNQEQSTSEQNNQQQTNQNTDENKQQSNQNTQNNEDNNKDLVKSIDSMYLALDGIKQILEPIISDNLLSSFNELDPDTSSEDSSYLIKRAQSLLDLYNAFLKYKDTKKFKDQYVEAKKYDLTNKGDGSDYHKYLAEMSNIKKNFKRLENESNLLREKMDLVKPKAVKESVDYIYDDLMTIFDEY